MRQVLEEVEVPTRGRGFYEVTEPLSRLVVSSAIRQGILTVMVRHTSASLVIQENADPEVRRDLERFLSRLVPDGDRLFQHTCEGPDDMPAHVRSCLTAVSLGIPVMGGRLTLGTWQGVFLWEHRTAPHRRRLAVHLLGEE